MLTGKKALSFERPEEERNLAMYFLSSTRKGRLFEVVESHIVSEENKTNPTGGWEYCKKVFECERGR